MTADTVGGVWTYALELSRALRPHGVEIVLATMGAPLTVVQRAAAAMTPNITLCESTYTLEWMPDPWSDVDRAGEWLLSLEREARPDVVHLNGYAHGALPFEAPVIVAAHSCVCSWWRAVRGVDAPEEWDEYRARVTRGLHAADEVVAPSRAMLDMLAPHYGEPARARVIHNGRDASGFVPSARKESFVLAAGRVWDEAKNIDALDRLSPRLAWPVYIAGDAHAPHGGERPLGSARFLGVLPPSALAWWMGRASVFAAPARYEPFGLSTLEAALAGCALVVGDIPSLREVWGDAACYVPPDDLDAIAAALDELAADDARRAEMAGRATRRASEFTPARMGDAYLRLYQELCASGRDRRSGAAPQPMEVTA